MKKIYITPCLKKTISMEEELLDVTSLQINDNVPDDEDLDSHGDLLAKPTNLYDVWEDDKEKLDFHTEN